MMTEISNTSWEGEIKNQGDTIRIRQAPSITINDYAGAGTTLTSEVPVPIFQDMQIDQGKYFQRTGQRRTCSPSGHGLDEHVH